MAKKLNSGNQKGGGEEEEEDEDIEEKEESDTSSFYSPPMKCLHSANSPPYKIKIVQIICFPTQWKGIYICVLSMPYPTSFLSLTVRCWYAWDCIFVFVFACSSLWLGNRALLKVGRTITLLHMLQLHYTDRTMILTHGHGYMDLLLQELCTRRRSCSIPNPRPLDWTGPPNSPDDPQKLIVSKNLYI